VTSGLTLAPQKTTCIHHLGLVDGGNLKEQIAQVHDLVQKDQTLLKPCSHGKLQPSVTLIDLSYATMPHLT